MASNLAEPTAEWAAYVSAHPLPPPADEFPDYLAERAEFDAALAEEFASLPAPDPTQLTISTLSIPVDSNGASIGARLYLPSSEPGIKRPLCIYTHGGGWYLGSPLFSETTARFLCASLGCIVFSIVYRLAPENPFPGLLEDCWKGLEYAFRHAEEWDADLSRVFTCGESAGGNLACALALKDADVRASKGGAARVKGVLGLCPETCHPKYVPAEYKESGLYISMTECENAPLLTANEMLHCWDLYCLKEEDKSNPYVSVLLHGMQNGHPPLYVQVAGNDPVRDEPVCYVKKLKGLGIQTKLDMLPGLPHLWWLVPELEKAGAEHREKLVEGVKWLFQQM